MRGFLCRLVGRRACTVGTMGKIMLLNLPFPGNEIAFTGRALASTGQPGRHVRNMHDPSIRRLSIGELDLHCLLGAVFKGASGAPRVPATWPDTHPGPPCRQGCDASRSLNALILQKARERHPDHNLIFLPTRKTSFATHGAQMLPCAAAIASTYGDCGTLGALGKVLPVFAPVSSEALPVFEGQCSLNPATMPADRVKAEAAHPAPTGCWKL